jgi:hypothetical protein
MAFLSGQPFVGSGQLYSEKDYGEVIDCYTGSQVPHPHLGSHPSPKFTYF